MTNNRRDARSQSGRPFGKHFAPAQEPSNEWPLAFDEREDEESPTKKPDFEPELHAVDEAEDEPEEQLEGDSSQAAEGADAHQQKRDASESAPLERDADEGDSQPCKADEGAPQACAADEPDSRPRPDDLSGDQPGGQPDAGAGTWAGVEEAGPAYIEFVDVVRSYGSGSAKINALDGASFRVGKGELAIILGASGAGKTTALNILGGMDRATSGQVLIDGTDISQASDSQLVEYRRTDVGFVFQFYNLVPNLTALENVEMATQVCKDAFDPAQTLEKVGLSERMDNFPAQLSGGEQQRVSIARAVAKNPKLLLCDEPTGALDYKTGKQILALLQEMCHREGMTVIIVTHNSALAPMADRLVRFNSGRVVEMRVNRNPVPVEQIEW